jgi:hypothetical protein
MGHRPRPQRSGPRPRLVDFEDEEEDDDEDEQVCATRSWYGVLAREPASVSQGMPRCAMDFQDLAGAIQGRCVLQQVARDLRARAGSIQALAMC